MAENDKATRLKKQLRPMTWADLGFWQSDWWDKIQERLITESVNPTLDKIFRALTLTPISKVRVVIMGQDPYPDPSMATGLAFSIPKTYIKFPQTLKNIFDELREDIGCDTHHGCLDSWAEQGVLLLNRYLTCRQGLSMSHADIGWEHLTDEIITAINLINPDAVYALWGKNAQEIVPLLDWSAQKVVSSHPSPMSAGIGLTPFIGSHPFSKINKYLKETGQTEIDWSLTFNGVQI